MCLKSSATALLVEKLVEANDKGNVIRPFCPHKWTSMHIRTSSWNAAFFCYNNYIPRVIAFHELPKFLQVCKSVKDNLFKKLDDMSLSLMRSRHIISNANYITKQNMFLHLQKWDAIEITFQSFTSDTCLCWFLFEMIPSHSRILSSDLREKIHPGLSVQVLRHTRVWNSLIETFTWVPATVINLTHYNDGTRMLWCLESHANWRLIHPLVQFNIKGNIKCITIPLWNDSNGRLCAAYERRVWNISRWQQNVLRKYFLMMTQVIVL